MSWNDPGSAESAAASALTTEATDSGEFRNILGTNGDGQVGRSPRSIDETLVIPIVDHCISLHKENEFVESHDEIEFDTGPRIWSHTGSNRASNAYP
jgi:hypothetical protein